MRRFQLGDRVVLRRPIRDTWGTKYIGQEFEITMVGPIASTSALYTYMIELPGKAVSYWCDEDDLVPALSKLEQVILGG